MSWGLKEWDIDFKKAFSSDTRGWNNGLWDETRRPDVAVGDRLQNVVADIRVRHESHKSSERQELVKDGGDRDHKLQVSFANGSDP
ncbi:hypothetical protein QJS10_CPB19g00104 [Acorus calamus]|uniref:Uncharacterized protein n=1 Tax=Acorus calamus TaxID=4465 RepID=A0AAV9CFV4_ACOCL|nr:hypothetical protein QJS10_CPB19g00104 [Acorus calamus]